MRIRASFAKKTIKNVWVYYFGGIPPSGDMFYPAIPTTFCNGGDFSDVWNSTVPGDLSIIDSTLHFKGEILIFESEGEVELTLDLKMTKKVKKGLCRSKNTKWIDIKLNPHGIFLKKEIKELSFIIRHEEKEIIKKLFIEINQAIRMLEGIQNSGWIKLLQD